MRVTFDEVHIDESSGYLIIMDTNTHYSNEGDAYFAVYSALANDTDLIEVRVQTPDSTTRAHMGITIDAALAGTAQLWKATTKTHVSGNAMTKMNRDHDSSNTSVLTICHTPAGAQAGASMLTRYLGAASTSGKAAAGGTGGNQGEFILARNTAYLIRVTSRADNNALTIVLDWNEHGLH